MLFVYYALWLELSLVTKRMHMIASIVFGDTLKGVFLIFEVPHVTVLCKVVHIQSENSHTKPQNLRCTDAQFGTTSIKSFVEAASGLYTMKSHSKEN